MAFSLEDCSHCNQPTIIQKLTCGRVVCSQSGKACLRTPIGTGIDRCFQHTMSDLKQVSTPELQTIVAQYLGTGPEQQPLPMSMAARSWYRTHIQNTLRQRSVVLDMVDPMMIITTFLDDPHDNIATYHALQKSHPHAAELFRQQARMLFIPSRLSDHPDTIRHHVATFPNLRYLEFQAGSDLTDAGIQTLCPLTQLPGLDIGLSSIGATYYHLQTLSVRACPLLTDAGLRDAVALQTTLRELDLGYCVQVTDVGIQGLFPLRQLQSLRVDHCIALTGAGVSSLTSLRHLDMSDCPRLAGLGLSALTRLRSLYLGACALLTDTVIQSFSTMSELEQLDVYECTHLTDRGIEALARLPGLQALDMSSCDRITDVGLQRLAEHTTLRALDLSGCSQITDVGIWAVSRLTQLDRLHLSECALITDAGLCALPRLTRLQTLHLVDCPGITDVGVLALSTLVHLQVLDLQGCDSVTDKALATATCLPM